MVTMHSPTGNSMKTPFRLFISALALFKRLPQGQRGTKWRPRGMGGTKGWQATCWLQLAGVCGAKVRAWCAAFTWWTTSRHEWWGIQGSVAGKMCE
jgi:hypothetical protein